LSDKFDDIRRIKTTAEATVMKAKDEEAREEEENE